MYEPSVKVSIFDKDAPSRNSLDGGTWTATYSGGAYVEIYADGWAIPFTAVEVWDHVIDEAGIGENAEDVRRILTEWMQTESEHYRRGASRFPETELETA